MKGFPSTKVFRGRKYHLFILAENKREALREAGRLRKNGYKARIHIGMTLFAVYSYPKTPSWYSGFFLRKRK